MNRPEVKPSLGLEQVDLRKCRFFYFLDTLRMKPKTQKSQELKHIKEKLPKSSITVFTAFSKAGQKGLSVGQMTELKKSLRGIAEYFVTKKTLTDKALKDLKYDGVDIFSLEGSLGIVFSEDDAYAVSKKLYEFAKKNQSLEFFGAWFENKFLDKESFLEMAKMPSRETLLARLAGMLKYPMSGLAITLNQVAQKKGATS